MGFFGLLFVIILVILLFGISMLHGVIRLIIDAVMSLFGMSRRDNRRSRQEPGKNRPGASPYDAKDPNTPRKKIFTKDEGEYVDFEEIKDP